MKKPWLAVLLNIIIPGMGYVYVGRRRIFGVLLIICDISSYFILTEEFIKSVTESFGPVQWTSMIVAVITWYLAFAFDAYQEAKLHNKAQVIPVPKPV